MNQRRLFWGYLAAAGTVAIWSGFVLISRLGGKSGLTGYDVLALRLATASLLLLPFMKGLSPQVWRDRRLWLLAMLGGVVYGLFVYTAFRFAPAAHGGILLSGMQPFLIMAVAWLLTGVLPGRQQMLGVAAICLGVGSLFHSSMNLPGAWSGHALLGDALLLLASAVCAWWVVLASESRRLAQDESNRHNQLLQLEIDAHMIGNRCRGRKRFDIIRPRINDAGIFRHIREIPQRLNAARRGARADRHQMSRHFAHALDSFGVVRRGDRALHQ